MFQINAKNWLALIAFTVWLAPLPAAWGQEENKEAVVVAVPTADKGPEDALNRGNPRDSITGFLKSASEFNWERAAEYLDLRNLPGDVAEVGGPELARQFNHVMARAVWFDDYSITDNPEGTLGDGLPVYRDELVTINTADGPVPIWMQQVPRGDGVDIWKISNRSVALVPDLYEEFSYSAPVERVRGWFPDDASFLGIEAFKWVIMLAFALVSWPVLYLLGWLLSRIFSSPKKENYLLVKKIFTGPLVLIGILFVANRTILALGAGVYAQEYLKAQTFLIIAVVWVFWSILNLVKSFQQAKLSALGRPGAAKLMQPLTTLLKILVLLFGVMFWLSNLGVNITTVLAGLGVGGLAVALALQKPLEDMMGALTIFTQATIRVGDFVRYGSEMGVVEDIGLRTTRLRTLTNTVVSVPNARIASVETENLSYRTKIRYWPTLRLRYDTSPDQLKTVIGGIREMLEQHEQVHDEPVRVRFTDFDKDAILIKINSFVKTTDFTQFLEVAEDLNFRIMEIVNTAGASFALPGQSIYMEGQASE
ncbi:MAG: mechanosensitive ion channel family protein [Xanthomonadales bacterium]|nr:mechanosensitive ion channel family protein [Gammaproteobacteria bacterium]NND56181.1 mechanosensitive ion channel family protein [Xanthomonadales bacterium]NNK50586.1 mechanosensitive ion channel family protein [Xanthomonadales bacterium]